MAYAKQGLAILKPLRQICTARHVGDRAGLNTRSVRQPAMEIVLDYTGYHSQSGYERIITYYPVRYGSLMWLSNWSKMALDHFELPVL